MLGKDQRAILHCLLKPTDAKTATLAQDAADLASYVVMIDCGRAYFRVEQQRLPTDRARAVLTDHQPLKSPAIQPVVTHARAEGLARIRAVLPSTWSYGASTETRLGL